MGECVDIIPPQQRIDEHWYQGTADAVYQNIYAIEKERPELVVILAGDHIYKMNYQLFVQYHLNNCADLTIGVLPVMREEAARQFGVLEVDAENRVVGFQEKPADPKPIPGDGGRCLASMGIYVAKTKFLCEELCRDAIRQGSKHDFGGNIIPAIMHTNRVFAYPFMDENRKQTAYWRDVGTLDAYYEANMDLVSVDPQLNMYDDTWPIRTYQLNYPPPKFVFAEEDRRGCALDSIVCAGTVLSGGLVNRSVIGPQCRINSYACITESVLAEGVNIGRHARIHRAIIDKDVSIPANAEIGCDSAIDRKRGFIVTDSGVTVIAKNHSIQQLSEEERA
jgi:glucose-1-phosphate adenylyltransferase